MPIELHKMTGMPYALQRNVEILREALESALARAAAAEERLSNLPPILTMEEIQQALSASGAYPLQTASLLNTTPPPTTPDPAPPVDDGIPDYLSIVQATATTFGITGATTDEQMFRFIQTVVQDINLSGMNPSGIVCGLTLAPPAGDNVFTCAGITYRYARVCFSNGHLFDILIDADPGGARTPQWGDNGFNVALYSIATDPSSPC